MAEKVSSCSQVSAHTHGQQQKRPKASELGQWGLTRALLEALEAMCRQGLIRPPEPHLTTLAGCHLLIRTCQVLCNASNSQCFLQAQCSQIGPKTQVLDVDMKGFCKAGKF